MKPTITDAHLQNTLSLMAHPRPYRQIFLESADALPPLFLLLDRNATYAEIIRTKNAQIEPSYFGETVLKFASLDFITGKGALAPRMTQEFDPAGQEALKHFATHLFLNLTWWYAGPMLWAIHFQCPYMPESRIKEFLQQKISPPLEQQVEYLNSIVAFMRSQKASVQLSQRQEIHWVDPYDDISGQLGEKGRYALRLLIGMFLDALENPRAPQAPDRRNTDLSPSVLEFIDSLDVENLGEKNNDTT